MRILLGVDFSRDSKAAIRFVSGFRFPPGSELFLLHVMGSYEELAMLHAYELEEGIRTLREKGLTRVKKNLNKLSEIVFDSRLKVHTLIKEGNSGKEILSILDQQHIDLAVLGTRGLSGVQRFLLGSVSEWILQEAPCPVLVVRGSNRLIHRGLRVLVAIDGSSEAQEALAFLNKIKLPPDSEIFLFHVVEGTDYRVIQDDFKTLKVGSSGQPDLSMIAQDIQKRKQVVGRSLVKDAKKGLSNRYTKGEHISTGHVAEEVLKAASRFRANLIVVGSRGLTGIRRQFLGSVSARVSQHAPCSVLVVRQLPKHEKIRL